jgi:putative endonuclease
MRLEYHNAGRCPHTSKFRPWEIVYSEQFENQVDAFKRERQIKGWTWAKKEALIAGDKTRLENLAIRRVY